MANDISSAKRRSANNSSMILCELIHGNLAAHFRLGATPNNIWPTVCRLQYSFVYFMREIDHLWESVQVLWVASSLFIHFFHHEIAVEAVLCFAVVFSITIVKYFAAMPLTMMGSRECRECGFLSYLPVALQLWLLFPYYCGLTVANLKADIALRQNTWQRNGFGVSSSVLVSANICTFQLMWRKHRRRAACKQPMPKLHDQINSTVNDAAGY